MPSVRARKPTGSVFMAKRTRTLPPTSSGPARPGSRQGRPGIIRTSLYLCRRPFMRVYGWLPFGIGAKSTISSWRGLSWRSGSEGGRVDGPGWA
jgi:hypothetical protein